jgi:hypothetical protein
MGINDLAHPEFSDAVDILPEEVPVFWDCGVTLQAALMEAKPELAITLALGAYSSPTSRLTRPEARRRVSFSLRFKLGGLGEKAGAKLVRLSQRR